MFNIEEVTKVNVTIYYQALFPVEPLVKLVTGSVN